MNEFVWKPNSIRKDQWPVVKKALEVMGKGISTQLELRRELDISTGRFSNLVKTLTREDLIVREIIPLLGRWNLALIRLSEKGKDITPTFCYEDLDDVNLYSEWEHMLKAHQADDQPKHTALTLYFAYFARMCGWTVNVVPNSPARDFYPDIQIVHDQTKYYFEIETGDRGFPSDPTDKWYKKWDKQLKHQKRIAMCTLTPGRLNRYRRMCETKYWSGFLTDLTTLRQKAKAGELQEFSDLFEMYSPPKRYH
ncbi:MAG: hypothetical protein JEZ06_24225 [Anaerolineaceae bacterium]|nr:hypothetical protein [Anaerolineaceae bacterium]